MSSLLEKLCPLILDGTAGVRSQLLKLFQVLPNHEVKDHISKVLPYLRAGMTHLSHDIRVSAIDFLSWLTKAAGEELVSTAGGWYKTLECFITILAWKAADVNKWSSKVSLGSDAKTTAHVMQVFAEFLQCGLLSHELSDNGTADMIRMDEFPLLHTSRHMMPTKSNTYAYLNLFGPPLDLENQILEEREERLRVFDGQFATIVDLGISAVKKEGGELGRMSGVLTKTLQKAHTIG